MIIAITAIYFAIVYAAFRVIKIPVKVGTITATIVIGIAIIGGIIIGWQGAAPVSQQLTVTRFIVALNPNVKGLIKEIHAKVGEKVKKDDLLFEVDPGPFQATVDQEKANLAAAEAQLDNLEAALVRAKATVERNEASAALAKFEHEAAQTLVAEGSQAISRLKVEALLRGYEAAEAAVNEAVAAVRQAEFAVVSGKANIGAVQGALDTAEFVLSETSYRAPADGMMVNWQARKGTITAVYRASAIGTFMETSNTRVIAVLPQNLMRKVAVGDPVELAFMSTPGKIDTGKVVRIINYTGEGQFVQSGDLPIVANVGSKGKLAVVVQLDDEARAQELALGAAGAAAIYSQPAGPFHAISKIYLRMLSLAFFLPV
jgi:membrane fusion protein (multidrug efflux system)